MTRRRLRSKVRGGWIGTLFRGKAGTRVGLNLFGRKHKRRRRSYR